MSNVEENVLVEDGVAQAVQLEPEHVAEQA
jgi:hypothetical protein